MSNYRRFYVPGGCYFFTLVCWQRKRIFSNACTVDLLRSAFRTTMQNRPFDLEAIVVLPDHLHCIWRLPENDHDFSGRWREVKKFVTRRLSSNLHMAEKRVWQPRFWEHLIRDEQDWERHLDYIHYNPVKHGLVNSPGDWPHTSFHAAVRQGLYDPDWGRFVPDMVKKMHYE
jgi:putative transposase